MKILYFAWIKQKIGHSEDAIACPETVRTVGDLAHYLKDQSAAHRDAFSDLDAIRVAVNQEFCEWDMTIKDSDEVAFFPPVTGG